MIVALVIVVVAAFLYGCYVTRQADARCRRLEVELLSVLGKTEAVSLVLSDERPPGAIRYATKTDDELRRERRKQYADAS